MPTHLDGKNIIRGDNLTPKAKRTKAKLLETAKQLFKNSGYKDVSVEKITKTAQVAKGTFYHYFTKKEDIVLELAFESIKNKQEQILETEEETYKKICDYIQTVFEETDNMPKELLRSWLHDSINGSNECSNVVAFPTHIKNFINELLKKEIQEKRLTMVTPSGKISTVLVTRIYGFITTWCIFDKEEKLTEYAMPVVKWEVKKLMDSYKNEPKN